MPIEIPEEEKKFSCFFFFRCLNFIGSRSGLMPQIPDFEIRSQHHFHFFLIKKIGQKKKTGVPSTSAPPR